MNTNKNTVIPQLSETIKTGIYFISTENISGNIYKKINVKIGRSIDLKKRLNQYHLYYPQGFYIYGLGAINNADHPKNGLHVHSIDTEILIHKYFDSFRLKTNTRNFNEWFYINLYQIGLCMAKFSSSFDYTCLYNTQSRSVGLPLDCDDDCKKIIIKDQNRVLCSDCQIIKYESRFMYNDHQYKTCNQCRLKRKRRRK